MYYYLLLAVLVGKEAGFQNSEADTVESPGLEPGGLRDWAWEKGRNEGRPRTELSSAVTRLHGGQGLGKGHPDRSAGARADGRTHRPTEGADRSPAATSSARVPARLAPRKGRRRPCPAESPARLPPQLPCPRPGAAASQVIVAS
ncbi:unnamed protein product [Pipistrellus nathusii]|uniref:Uncharacterized protein n=1 Tax=Pipistrellus nathusii TaxID=59473 RepID=A0ABP0A8Q4_PIPNA